MLRRFTTRRIVLFFLIDILGTLIVLLLAERLRLILGALPQPTIEVLRAWRIPVGWTAASRFPPQFFPRPVLLLVAIIWIFFLVVFSVYDGHHNETLWAEMFNVFQAVGISTLTLAGVLFFSYRETSRVLLVLFFLGDITLLLGSRIFLYSLRRAQRLYPVGRQRVVLVVGAGIVGQNVVEQLRKYAWGDIYLLGFLDDDPQKQGQQIAGLPVLGPLEQVEQVVNAHQVNDAVIALPLRAHDNLVQVCSRLQKLGTNVHVIPDLFALSFPSAALEGFGGIPVISLGHPGIYGWQSSAKRAFDVLFTLFSLILLSPVLAIITLAVKLDSPGPVIFKQQRIGKNGRIFTMLKFRSMRVDADPAVHQAHVTELITRNVGLDEAQAQGQESLKLAKDKRITRVGQIIRATSMDELPQLVNVLRGEMSMVGPRPSLPYEVDLYQEWHRRRFEATPGITGLWQVKGRNRVSFDEAIRLDLEYIEHQSIWLDFRILLQTPMAVITGHGAG